MTFLVYDPTKCENILITRNDDDKTVRKESKIKFNNDIDIEELEKDMGWNNVGKKKETRSFLYSESLEKVKKELKPIDELLDKKSVIKPGFERLDSVPIYELNRKRLAAQRRRVREKTKGKKWFDLPAPEMTEEIKRDLEVIQMRSVLDPKHFYKKNDLKVLPKYFQIGKVVDSPLDYYNNRLTNKERKKTIVDELMANAEFSKFNKRKYKEIVDDNRKKQFKSFRHAKKLKGKKKK